MKQYLGITIGPIFETILLADKPAKLWFASTIFSDLTARLCEMLLEKFEQGKKLRILMPYFEKKKNKNYIEDGVGKYHDRIICEFEGNGEDVTECLNELIRTCKKGTLERFQNTLQDKDENKSRFESFKDKNKSRFESFLESYLQIHYLILSEEDITRGSNNIIFECSSHLDALELMRTFPGDNGANVFLEMFKGKDNADNRYVKDSNLFSMVQESDQLRNASGDIRSLEEIANNGGKSKGLKKFNYFAVVSADGDGMGKVIEGMGQDVENVLRFSKVCLNYTKEASELIRKYGGMTIYAGGDDLLFLAPVENSEGKSLLGLCHEISLMFGKKMKQEFTDHENLLEPLPSVSFGIAIQYVKYPLYEAFERAHRLLFVNAKSGEKNKMAVDLEKHSGQKIFFQVSNSKYEVLDEFLKTTLKVEEGEETAPSDQDRNGFGREDELLHSIIYKLPELEPVLQLLGQELHSKKKEDFISIWMNFFDNPNQNSFSAYLKTIGAFYFSHLLYASLDQTAGNNILENGVNEGSKANEKASQNLQMLLRYKKFLVETGEE